MIPVLSILAVGPAGAVPAPPAVTPQSVTRPIVEASCAIGDTRGGKFKLRLRQSGGRGYDFRAADGLLRPGRTDIKFEVLEDTSGQFRGREFMRSAPATWPGTFRAFEGRRSSIQFQTIETDDQNQYAMLIQTRWPSPSISYLGLCNVKKTPQSALTGAEAEKASKQ